jgi:hypothetical protein
MAKSMTTVARRRRRRGREAMAGGGRLGTPSLAVFYDLFPQFFFSWSDQRCCSLSESCSRQMF